MKVIFYLIRYSGWKFFLSAGLSLLGGISGTVAIKTINDAIHNGVDDSQSFIIYVVTSLILFTVLSLVSTKLLHKIIQELIKSLSMTLGEKVLNSPFKSVEHKKEELFTVLTYDIYTISNTIERVPNLFVAVTVALGCASYILYISVYLSLLIVGVLSLIFFILMFYSRKLSILSNNTRILYDTYVEKTNHLIYGIKELQQNQEHKSHFLRNVYQKVLNERKENSIKEKVAIQFSDKLAESLALFGLSSILIATIYFVPESQAKFSEIFTISLFIIGPLTLIISFSKSLKTFEASINSIKSLDIELTKFTKDTKNKNLYLAPPIKMKEVIYQYDKSMEGGFQVGPLNLTFEAGSIYFVTGGNGSGKTTLGKVITGLYPITSGLLKCNGNIDGAGQAYRDLFSVIWNDNYVFEDIGYISDPDAKSNLLLEKTDLTEKTSLKNGKFSDIKLSSGQQKRISLVTALLEDRPAYLFDEWAANQDIEFKRYFYEEVIIELKKKGKVVIVITHDHDYFHIADQVIELRNGQVL